MPNERTCPDCKGTKKCNHCHGAGTAHDAYENPIDCPDCHGSGHCPACEGKGFVSPMQGKPPVW
jgi:DnaJ-class molecular chaperone